MRKQRLRKNLAQFVIDRRSARRNSVTAAIATQCAEECAVRGTGVQPVQAVDDVQSFFVGFQSVDWFRQFRFRQRSAVLHPRGNAGFGIEPLILHEEDDAFGRRVWCRRREQTLRQNGSTHSGTCTGGESLQQISTTDHDRTFNVLHGRLF